jgi:eukaryotic-like serine/threonine-protein kinase
MAIATISELTETLRQLELLNSHQLEQFERDAKAPLQDVKRLTGLLIERGYLTRFQAEKVLEGKGQSLILGNYLLVTKLGEGGMGTVYKAWQRRLNRLVAIKTIREEKSNSDDRSLRRFQREAQLAAQMLHPNIVVVHDADQAGNTHFIVMEYIEGIDLARLVKRSGPLAIPVACDYIRQAALGLQHAYEHNLVHRDIKPSNLLVAEGGKSGNLHRSGPIRETLQGNGSLPGSGQGVIKILDLGLACLNSDLAGLGHSSLTQKGMFLGTPDFIAPEQARNASSVDIRADLYSLGCTLYFLLTGRPPFVEGTSIEKLVKHQLEKPTPIGEIRPETPEAVVEVIKKLMAKKPEKRFQTPQELADALQEIQQSLGDAVQTRPATDHAMIVAGSEDLGKATGNETARSSWGGPPVHSTIHDAAVPSIKPAQKWAALKAHHGCVLSLGFSWNSSFLATSGVDQRLRIWDLDAPVPNERTTIKGITIGETQALTFSPDGQYLFAGSASNSGLMFRCRWVHADLDNFQIFHGEEAPTAAMAVSPDGEHLVTAMARKAWLWSVGDKKVSKRTELTGHRAEFKAAAFAPDSKHLAVGDDDGLVFVWRIGRLWTKQINSLVADRSGINSIAFSPDGQEIVTGDINRHVHVWGLMDKGDKPRETYSGLSAQVRQVLFLDGGRSIMGLGQNGHAMVWDRATRSPLTEVIIDQVFIVQVAASPEGNLLAAALSDGSVVLYKLSPGRGEQSTKSTRTELNADKRSDEKTRHTKVVPTEKAELAQSAAPKTS